LLHIVGIINHSLRSFEELSIGIRSRWISILSICIRFGRYIFISKLRYQKGSCVLLNFSSVSDLREVQFKRDTNYYLKWFEKNSNWM